MKTMAIICEYNPFHNGHAYQISQHRSCCGVDCVIAVMSGNFVQRGAPALCDKWTRAKMALMGGCDLVLELPAVFAVQSAERFARGAVEMIDSMGFVDFLSFGSECGDIAALTRAAQVLLEPDFQAQVAKRMKSGTSYPAARAAALSDALGGNCANLLARPNNLLAIEYLKNLLRLNSKTVPITLRRTAGHHQSIAENGFCSASHLRERITDGDEIDGLIPQPALTAFREAVQAGKAPVRTDGLDPLVTYLLRTQPPDTLRRLPDMTEGLEGRFVAAGRSRHTFSAIAEAVKTKRYTRTRIDRTLIHLLLGITKQDTELSPCYYRVLGANRTGTQLLRRLQSAGAYPVITKTAGMAFEHPEAIRMFQVDCRATDVYSLLFPTPENRVAGLDFTTSPIIIQE